MEGPIVCMEGVMVANVKAEPDCSSAESEGTSPARSGKDTSVSSGALVEQQSVNKTHHLLRHCLNMCQRAEALQHFGSTDYKEAAKEISRMGQRELQGKFKLVYGTTTHSNNNNWLRRKLFEAIGAAPLKANSKGKARKPHVASRPKKSSQQLQHSQHYSQQQQQQQCLSEVPSRGACSFMQLGMHAQQPLMVPTPSNSARCSPRGAVAAPRRPVGAPAAAGLRSIMVPMAGCAGGMRQPAQRAGAPRQLHSAAFPSSPLLSGSVLDMHRYGRAMSSAETGSDSDEEGSWEGSEVEEHCNSKYNNASSSNSPFAPRATLAGSPATEGMGPLCAAFKQAAAMQQKQQVAAATMTRQDTLGLGTLDLGLLDPNNDWAWGPDCDVLGSFDLSAQASLPGGPSSPPSGSSSLDDDDMLLLPMDFSAIDTFSFA